MRAVVEPSGRKDEWAWQVRRKRDRVIVGLFKTQERAEAWIASTKSVQQVAA
ncbi:MAG TPA: hypothetical protein VMU59_07415 [Caulobacteraceae bacterium]|nr:hypothetical protein [Caulobacteraceae bacterium]